MAVNEQVGVTVNFCSLQTALACKSESGWPQILPFWGNCGSGISNSATTDNYGKSCMKHTPIIDHAGSEFLEILEIAPLLQKIRRCCTLDLKA